MLRNITNECITVTKKKRSMVFWKGIVLCETVYEEQPYEIDGMSITLVECDNGTIEVLVKTPVSEGSYDYHVGFVFDNLMELSRFERTPFDPLNRGFYPLQSKLENGSLADITENFNTGRNRVYLDTNIMATIISAFFENHNRFPIGNELEETVFSAYSAKAIEMLNNNCNWLKTSKLIKFYVLSVLCQMRVVEDPFGEFLVIEYERVDFQANLRMAKHIDIRTNDIVISINGVPFDHLENQRGHFMSQYGLAFSKSFVMEESSQTIIEHILNNKGNPNEAVGKLIDLSRYNRSYSLSVNHKIISRENTSISNIVGFGTLDYEAYLSQVS